MKIENKMTAVEYLVEQLLPKALSAEQYYHIEQAKEMEKQQIIDAYYEGKEYGFKEKGEEYYNETFNNED